MVDRSREADPDGRRAGLIVVHGIGNTIGSPLNKFWFVDYEGERRRDGRGLEDNVETSWINYWALSDPVSGVLRHFDGPNLRVTNHRLRWLGPLLLSHNAYWKREDVIENLRHELIPPVAGARSSPSE